MLLRLALAVVLAAGPLAAAGITPVMAQATAEMSTEELMEATALDEVFAQFGPSIAASPSQQGAPFTADMQAAWQSASAEVFDAGRMHDALAGALDEKFEPEDYAAFTAFFHSGFGRKVSGIERAVTMLPPDLQLTARDEGIALATGEDARRHAQIEEMLTLVSAEIATSMIRQSVRGMLIGMSMTGQQGDIEVPWEEIDAHLDTIMPGIEGDVEVTQRAMMYFAYRDLTEAELEDYLAFLRTASARKFYAVAAYSIGEIIAERMQTFGETLARNLARVNV